MLFSKLQKGNGGAWNRVSVLSPAAARSLDFAYFTTDWNSGEVSRLANSLSDEE
jgi:hypothetical protein